MSQMTYMTLNSLIVVMPWATAMTVEINPHIAHDKSAPIEAVKEKNDL